MIREIRVLVLVGTDVLIFFKDVLEVVKSILEMGRTSKQFMRGP